jgi:tripartite ATP-independent transporter DctM subunit
MLAFTVIILAVLLSVGMPIAFALGVSSVFVFQKLGDPFLFKLIAQRMFAGCDKFVLLAIPFFIFAGQVMSLSGITDRLIGFSNALVGHLRGGLAHANIVASIFFAGLTGSAVSDTAAIGTVMIPAMEKEGYDLGFSAAVTGASSVIGPIIPPSIIMVIYAVVMQVSVGGLFAAGLLPGLLVGVTLMIAAYFISRRRNYPKKAHMAPLGEMWNAFRGAILALVMPVLILGGILTGFFTPTEAAAVAVAYGLFVGIVIFRNIKPKALKEAVIETCITTGIVLFVLGTATVFGWIVAAERMSEKLAQALLSVSNNPYIILFLINLILIVAGMFMDTGVAIILLGPILGPIGIQMGLHPLHFAIVMCVNLTVGLATPPMGLILFVTCGITELSMERLVKAILPFLMVELFVVFLITYVPIIPMLIPRLLGYIK